MTAVLRLLVVLSLIAPAVNADAFRDALDRAVRERKPLLVVFAPESCRACDVFETRTLRHPVIVRRLPHVVLATVPIPSAEADRAWGSPAPGVALYDLSGNLRVRWETIPDTALLGAILDGVNVIAPALMQAFDLGRADVNAAEVEIAIALARIGRIAEARLAVGRVLQAPSAQVAERAAIVAALLDAREGKAEEALAALERIGATSRGENLAEAWVAAGMIRYSRGEEDLAVEAYRRAVESGAPDSAAAKTAATLIKTIESRRAGLIQIVPFSSQVLSGPKTVRAQVGSTSVSSVVFTLDGRPVARADRPPFTALVDFGSIPHARVLRASAFDRRGRELGHHEITVNDGGEIFWIRLLEPREGLVSGRTAVAVTMRTPPSRTAAGVEITWNDRPIARLTSAPWRTSVDIPEGQLGVLRVLAVLDDGSTAEDALLLNAIGGVERTEVQLVELPVTVLERSGRPAVALAKSEVSVREGRQVRIVDSITPASESTLTVGLVIDVSSSMREILPDLQEAASRFIDALLGPKDRAMLITFDDRARLVVPSTTDKSVLQQALIRLQPNGLTALHDAVILGLLQFEGVKGRRALVVFTDGIDRTSEYTLDDVRDFASRANVPIFVISGEPERLPGAAGGAIPGTRPPATAPPITVHEQLLRALDRVARSTGGELYEMRRLESLPRIYDDISAALRAQFLVAIRSNSGDENEWRPLDVDVKRRGVKVHAPSGYYAPQ